VKATGAENFLDIKLMLVCRHVYVATSLACFMFRDVSFIGLFWYVCFSGMFSSSSSDWSRKPFADQIHVSFAGQMTLER